MSEWISVKDRLPDDTGKHLVVVRDFTYRTQTVKTAYFAKCLSSRPYFKYRKKYYSDAYDRPGWWNCNDNDEWEELNVTHWMPLPKPPKEG